MADKPEQLTIKLRTPIELGGQTYTQIDLVEPTAGQMKRAADGQNGVAANILLVAEVAKVLPAVVEQIGKRDFEAAVDFLQSFTNDAP